MTLKKNRVYNDSKYGCDLVVRRMLDSVVLIEELDTGNNHLYGREEFDDEKGRFRER